MSPDEAYCDPFGIPMPATHYQSFGRFLIACAAIETAAHLGLRGMIPVEDQLARTLIGQPRLDDLLTILGKVCADLGHGPSEKAAFSEIKGYIAYIYRVRNIVAHQKPSWRDGWMRYDRYETAKDISRRPELIYVLQLSELDNLTELTRAILKPLGLLTKSFASTQTFDQAQLRPLRALLQTLELPADPAQPFRVPARK